MIYDVPFVPNTEDDLHCLQAAYMMILKYFKPDYEIAWDEWSRLTGFEAGKGTWASAGVLWFYNHGFDVKHYEVFDYDEFFKSGGDYLIQKSGKTIGRWQIKHSNIPLEQKRGKQMTSQGLLEEKEPTIADIKNYLDDGCLLHALLNSRKLNGKDGYFGHAVTVIGYDQDSLIIHDPGSPPRPSRSVAFADFEAAWADPNKDSKELSAIRPRS